MRETKFWLLSMLCGVVIFIFLTLHLGLFHLKNLLIRLDWLREAPLSFTSMAGRSGSLGWGAFYLVLLAAALYHGLYGLRAVLLELPSLEQRPSEITYGVSIVGLLFFLFGAYVILSF